VAEAQDDKPSLEIEVPSDADTATVYSGSAVYANKVFVHLTGGIGRLTFVETAPGAPQSPRFRSAVMMTLADITTLSAVLQELLKRHPVKVTVVKREGEKKTDG